MDDNKFTLHLKNGDDSATFQNSINKITEWTDDHGLRLNTKKCAVILFNKLDLNPVLKINSEVLKYSIAERDLEIIMDSDLKFHKETDKRVHTALGIAKRLRFNVVSRSKNIWIRLYKTFIRPILVYG